MTRRDKALVWRARIDRAKDRRRAFFEGSGCYADPESNETGMPGANFAIAAYRGEIKPRWWSPEDPYVNVNKTKAAIRAALPSMLYSNPEYQITPRATDVIEGPEAAYARAKAQEIWVNHVYREAHGNTHVRVAIQNAFCAYGVVKAGYRVQFQDDESRGVFARDEETGEILIDEATGDPLLERGEFLTDEDGETIRDEDGIPVLHPGKLTKEHWFIEAVDPRMMLFDVDSGTDYFQHRWVIEEWVRPLEAVRRDPRFPRSVRRRLGATESSAGDGYRKSSFVGMHERDEAGEAAVRADEALVRGYDIYDFENEEYLVLCDLAATDESAPLELRKGRKGRRSRAVSEKPGPSNDDFLLDGPMPPGMEHGPYRFLKFTEDMGTEWYPIPDGIDMALLNQEYNVTRSQMMIHREHTKSRYMETPGAFETEGADADEERAKFAHGPDGVTIKVSGPNALLPAPKAQLDQSFFAAIPNIAADFNEIAGMPGESRGVADADTATQASILAVGAETRNSDRRDNQVAAFLSQIGRMLLMSAQANAELDSLVLERVTQEAGMPPFLARRVTPEELKGEFEVEVAVGSTQPKNSPQTMNTILNLLNALAQNPGVGQYRGLIARVLDGMAIDPLLAQEIAQVSESLMQQQQRAQGGSPEGPGGDVGQVIASMLGNGTGNAAAGAQTGAPSNRMM